jgi:sarcosine oxidase
MSYDVIVVGLGGMGSAAAYHLAARGQRVLGLERHTPAHDKGSSHGGSRITRQSYFEDPAYVPLLLRSYELWEQLARDSGEDVLALTGGLFLGRPDSVTVAGSLRAAREWDLPHEVLSSAEVSRRFPTFTPAEDEVALYEAKAGFVRPETTVAAHLALAARAGADLHFTEPVLSWESTAGGVRVTTAEGTYEAGRLVIAPGAWAPQLLADLGVPITIERQVMYWFEPLRGVGPYTADRHPVYIHEDAEGTQIYGFPAIDGPGGGAAARSAPPTRSTGRCTTRRSSGCARRRTGCCRAWPPATSSPRPACTPTPRTSTSSSRSTPPTTTSPWPAGSPVTASSSCPSSARCSPTSPRPAAPHTRSVCSTPAGRR